MAIQTRLARLARLESAVEAVRYPTVLEFHRAVPVAADDRRRGSFVVAGNAVTFHCATADEYLEASRDYAGDRNLVVISIDARCIDFKQEGAL